MIENLPRYSLILLLLVAAQVLVFNHIHVGGWLNTYPYILFILILPSSTNRAALLVLAFIVGISIDMFSDSQGIHAAALIPVAYLRSFVLRTTTNAESKNDDFEPNLFYFDRRQYISYATVLVLLHHSILFFLEVFEFNHFFYTLFKIVGSTVLTVILIILIQYIFIKRKE